MSGRRQGSGTMRYSTGEVEDGEWKDNLYVSAAEEEAAPAPETDEGTEATAEDAAPAADQ